MFISRKKRFVYTKKDILYVFLTCLNIFFSQEFIIPTHIFNPDSCVRSVKRADAQPVSSPDPRARATATVTSSTTSDLLGLAVGQPQQQQPLGTGKILGFLSIIHKRFSWIIQHSSIISLEKRQKLGQMYFK